MQWVLDMEEDKKKEWKENLKSAYTATDSFNKDIKTLIEIIIYTSFGEKIGRLYKIVDDDKLFSKLIEEFENNEIQFPSKDDFTESVITAIIYYYKEVLGLSWEQIQEQLPYESDIGLRYARKINNLGDKIKKRLKQIDKNKKVEIEESLFDK